MKKISKLLVLIIWGILLFILFRLNLLTGDISIWSQLINDCENYKEILFVAVFSLRVIAFVPSAIFVLLGGIIFNPLKCCLLSLISVIISESIVYVISKSLLGSKIEHYLVGKYPKFYKILQSNNTKVLTLGILCPVTPSDVACFLASSTGLSYIRFMIIVIAANMPEIVLYSFFESSFKYSANSTIILVSFIIVIIGYTTYLWKREQKQHI
ncbi:MAG: TVP38/TMEM64 family protein [Clostridium sp.]